MPNKKIDIAAALKRGMEASRATARAQPNLALRMYLDQVETAAREAALEDLERRDLTPTLRLNGSKLEIALL